MSSNTAAEPSRLPLLGRAARVLRASAAGLALLAAPHAGAEGEAVRLGAGDRLDVQVWQEPDLSGAHRIEPDGTIQHVLLGRVLASGLTPDELARELALRLERGYLRAPRVAVSVIESSRRVASVLGPVVRPGTHPVTQGMRVLDLLVAAGGLGPEAGRSATLLRPASGPAGDGAAGEAAQREIDLAGLLRGTDPEANPPVEPGDVLVVTGGGGAPAVSEAPAARVRVVGEVATPGAYALGQAPTVLDAVLAAGGLTEYAAGNRARLVRGEGEARTEERIRLGDLLEGKGDGRNPELEPGDLIVVPESFF